MFLAVFRCGSLAFMHGFFVHVIYSVTINTMHSMFGFTILQVVFVIFICTIYTREHSNGTRHLLLLLPTFVYHPWYRLSFPMA